MNTVTGLIGTALLAALLVHGGPALADTKPNKTEAAKDADSAKKAGAAKAKSETDAQAKKKDKSAKDVGKAIADWGKKWSDAWQKAPNSNSGEESLEEAANEIQPALTKDAAKLDCVDKTDADIEQLVRSELEKRKLPFVYKKPLAADCKAGKWQIVVSIINFHLEKKASR